MIRCMHNTQEGHHPDKAWMHLSGACHRVIRLVSVLGCLGGASAVVADTFREGQMWRCSVTSGQPPIIYVIGRIDAMNALVPGLTESPETHVASLSFPETSAALPPIGHAPVAASMLGKCDEELVAENAALDTNFEEGYAIWSSAMRAGEAGIWTAPADEVYKTILGLVPE